MPKNTVILLYQSSHVKISSPAHPQIPARPADAALGHSRPLQGFNSESLQHFQPCENDKRGLGSIV